MPSSILVFQPLHHVWWLISFGQDILSAEQKQLSDKNFERSVMWCVSKQFCPGISFVSKKQNLEKQEPDVVKGKCNRSWLHKPKLTHSFVEPGLIKEVEAFFNSCTVRFYYEYRKPSTVSLFSI